MPANEETPPAESNPPIEDDSGAERLLLLYIAADNNLSNYVQLDLQEVLSAAHKVPDNCYMLAFVDDKKDPRVLRYFNNKGVGDYETVHNFGREFASCDTADVRVLFGWVQENYPAKAMDMVLWSHGSGWLHGDGRMPVQQFSFGYDDTTWGDSDKNRMYVEELAGLFEKMGIKLERLMFDACFMQCAEVAYTLRESVDWLIASPAEIPGYGAPYDNIVPLFFDATATPGDIIDAYKKDYDGTDTGVVLSAVRCSAMQQLADATAVLVKKHLASVSGSECGSVFSYLPGGYFRYPDYFPNFFDMNAVAAEYLSPDDYATWKFALDEALPYRCASSQWYSYILKKDITVGNLWSGISMYIPNTDYRFRNFNTSFALLEWYNAAAWNEVK